MPPYFGDMSSRSLLLTGWLYSTPFALMAQYAPAVQLDQFEVKAPHWFDADGDGDQDAAFFGDHFCLSKNAGQGLFAQFQLLPPRTNWNNDVGSMDVDLDGDPDLVVVGFMDDSATYWLENEGGGLFDTLHLMPNIGFNPGGDQDRFHYVDLNGDTLPDLLATNQNSTRYVLNGWPGPFSSQTDFNAAKTAALGDIDLDGQLDIIGWESNFGSEISWWRNSGGVFSQVAGPVGTVPGIVRRLEVFDVEHDGDSDVVSFAPFSINMMLNDTANGFSPPISLSSFGFIPQNSRIADLDGDGFTDLVVQTNQDSISYMRNNGDGTFDPLIHLIRPVLPSEEFELVDLNNDALLDIGILCSGFSGLTWFEQGSSLTFGAQRSVVFCSDHHYATPSWGDLDADGDIDVMMNGLWLEQTAPGVLDVVHTTNYNAKNPAPADLNGDGLMDCFTFWTDGDDSGLFQYMHGGEGDWPSTQIITGYGQRSEILTWDPDGDNDVDLLRPVFGDGVSAFVNDGSGQFSTTDIIGADPSQPYRAAIADFDGDGDDDVAATGVYNGLTQLLVHSNNGGWSFPSIPGPVTPVSWWGGSQAVKHVRAADLDLDGTPDIVTDKGGEIIWYENHNGNGTDWVEHAFGLQVSLEFFAFELADVDADGDIDLLYIPANGEELLWLANDGDGLFSDPQVLIMGDQERVYGVRAVDLDADLDPELLVNMAALAGFRYRTLLLVDTMSNSLGLHANAINKPLSAHPVPADQQARIDVDPMMLNDGLFYLTDPGGRTLRTWSSALPDALTIERDGLLPGVYLLTLRSAHHAPMSGRIVFR